MLAVCFLRYAFIVCWQCWQFWQRFPIAGYRMRNFTLRLIYIYLLYIYNTFYKISYQLFNSQHSQQIGKNLDSMRPAALALLVAPHSQHAANTANIKNS